MPLDFSDQGPDFSGLYTDPGAPKDADPADELFKTLQSSSTPAVAAPATPTAPTTAPASAPQATAEAPAQPSQPAAATTAAPNPSSVNNPAADQSALLARLAPLGIKDVATLKGKTDVELRQLAGNVVEYEQRQRDLTRHFFKNPDGSWDFTKGPDGQPTGLDAAGHVLPVGGDTPAPAPAAPKPAAKPKPKAKKKPAAKKKSVVTKKKAVVTKKITGGVPKVTPKAAKPKAKAKPKPKKPNVVTAKPLTPSGGSKNFVL